MLIDIYLHDINNFLYYDIQDISKLLIFTIIPKRANMSKEDKFFYSNQIPSWLNEVMCGMMLSDGNLRMNGNNALFSVQQTHQELTEGLWKMCHDLNLTISPVKTFQRPDNRKLVYYFQSLTMPYFTNVYNTWYKLSYDNNKVYKVVPNNIDELLTPIGLAYWIKGYGSFNNYGRGLGRISLHTNWFTLNEVNLL
jgi:hypothetical protein